MTLREPWTRHPFKAPKMPDLTHLERTAPMMPADGPIGPIQVAHPSKPDSDPLATKLDRQFFGIDPSEGPGFSRTGVAITRDGEFVGMALDPLPNAKEAVNHPPHYNMGAIEVIDALESWGCGFHDGNVIKYVARFRHKNGLEDLKKAQWYLTRLIEKLQKGNAE